MSSVAMTMTNPALPGDPVRIYIGVTATLNISLSNNTGSDIEFNRDSSLEIFFPFYFKAMQLQQMRLSNISQDGWVASYNSVNASLVLRRSGDVGTWPANRRMNFSIDNVNSAAAPNSGSVQINLQNMSGSDIPFQLSSALALVAQPQPGNLELQDMLSVEPMYGGAIYVSNPSNPLNNTIYLNIKNIGATPLFNGRSMWRGTPRITVSFVYGTTSGSLAPDDKQDASEVGSAWGISGAIYVDQSAGWTIQNPVVSGQANTPVWTLAPVSTNQQVIGTGDRANVTIAFSNVISMTPTGPTQMYVQFSGFMADDNTPYNDRIFVVALTKQNPSNPGALGIHCLVDSIQVSSDKQILAVPLQWSMSAVGSVRLGFSTPSGPKFPDKKYSYGTAHPVLNYDTETFVITGIASSAQLTVYCSAYSDSNWQNLLNKVECTVPLIFPPVIHSFQVETTVSAAWYKLTWDIAGATRFQIVADNGDKNPVALDIPDDATSFIVELKSDITTYKLTVTGNAPQERTTSMPDHQMLQNATVSDSVTITSVPVGTIVCYAGAKPPDGWLLCDGAAISTDGTYYYNLRKLLASDNTPDLRSRFIVGAAQAGASSPGLTPYSLSSVGGAETVTLTTAQMPAHSHNIHGGNFGIYSGTFSGKSGGDDHPYETAPSTNLSGTDNAGGNLPHPNLPPYYALTYIIKI